MRPHRKRRAADEHPNRPGQRTATPKRLWAALAALLIAMPVLATVSASPSSAHTKTVRRCIVDPPINHCWDEAVSHTHSDNTPNGRNGDSDGPRNGASATPEQEAEAERQRKAAEAAAEAERQRKAAEAAAEAERQRQEEERKRKEAAAERQRQEEERKRRAAAEERLRQEEERKRRIAAEEAARQAAEASTPKQNSQCPKRANLIIVDCSGDFGTWTIFDTSSGCYVPEDTNNDGVRGRHHKHDGHGCHPSDPAYHCTADEHYVAGQGCKRTCPDKQHRHPVPRREGFVAMTGCHPDTSGFDHYRPRDFVGFQPEINLLAPFVLCYLAGRYKVVAGNACSALTLPVSGDTVQTTVPPDTTPDDESDDDDKPKCLSGSFVSGNCQPRDGGGSNTPQETPTPTTQPPPTTEPPFDPATDCHTWFPSLRACITLDPDTGRSKITYR